MTGAADTQALIVEHDGSVLFVSLNRPDALNALNGWLMADLAALWQEAAADRSLRCVVVTGAGRAFCAGADVEMLRTRRSTFGATWRDELTFLPGHQLDVPVIVAVNGVCAGGGLHFVADADIAIAAESATFLDPHVSVGHVTGLEPVELLLRARRDAVVRMALLGRSERLTAEAAERAGLVSEVVPDDRLRDRARTLAEMIVANSPAAVRESRAVIRRQEASLVATALEDAWLTIQRHWDHPDAFEGPAAFAERRPPAWTVE